MEEEKKDVLTAPSKQATMQQIKVQRESNERSLRSAADKGDVDEVRRLLGLRGANNQDQISPNAADVAGHTALHFAAYSGHDYVVEELISEDATDLFAKTDLGNTAFDLARKMRETVCAKKIEDAVQERGEANKYNLSIEMLRLKKQHAKGKGEELEQFLAKEAAQGK